MALDPNIILGAQTVYPQFNPMNALQQASSMQAFQTQQRNALLAQKAQEKAEQVNALLAQPGAIDEKTGIIAPKALEEAYKIDPKLGQEYTLKNQTIHRAESQDELAGLQIDQAKSEIGMAQREAADQVVTEALDVYQAAMKQPGATQASALKAGQEVYSKGLQELMKAHAISEDQLHTEFKPVEMMAKSKGFKAEKAAADKEAREEKRLQISDRREREQESRDKQRFAVEMRKAQAPELNAQGGIGAYTAQDLDYLADQYNRTGKMPSGISSRKEDSGVRQAIIARATAKGVEGGGAGEMATYQTILKADQAALNQNIKLASMIDVSEGTAQNEIKLAKQALTVGGAFGPKIFNGSYNSFRRNVGDSSKIGPVDTALETLGQEYIKVMTTSSGTGNAMSTDAATRNVKRFLDADIPVKTLLANMDMMQQSMAGRKKVIQTEQELLKNQIKTMPGSANAKPGAAPKPGSRLKYDAQGNLVPA